MKVNEKEWTQIQLDKLRAHYATLLRRIELLEEAGADVRAEGFLAGVRYERHADDEAYDGWTDWHGGDECPVDPKTQVDVILRNGEKQNRYHPAGFWIWPRRDPEDNGKDIMRYRVVEAETPTEDDDMGPAPTEAELRASGYLPIEEVSKDAAKEWARLNRAKDTPDDVVEALRTLQQYIDSTLHSV